MRKILSIVLTLLMILNLSACSGTDINATLSEIQFKNEETASKIQEVASSNLNALQTSSESEPSGTISKAPSEVTVSAPASVGSASASTITLSKIPAYSNKAYITINNNLPYFSASELTTKAYETYSPLDSKGRCGVALASCGKEIMPKAGEERGSISSVKPSGWIQAKYSGISGGYLWNRCHLIGWQLSAENANKKNLITGTRYMNINGMLPFENMVADYINETGNHVAYRITPVYNGGNLVCSGVQMEAYSVEDNGEGICFNVYCYNVQPGITINYATGASSGPSSATSSKTSTSATISKSTTISSSKTQTTTPSADMVWIPKSGSKYHSSSSCSNMKNPSKVTKSQAESMGYEPCKKCY